MVLQKEAIRTRFRKAGTRQGWWTTDYPVIAAVSGGGDSIALLWMLKTFWKGSVVVAHLEHGIRGESSLSDALFVDEISQKWGFKAEIVHRDVPREKRRGESIEDAARRLRYDFFDNLREKHSAHWVLLGHNANDIAETILFHLFRGTGLRGLVGIPETRDCYARPLVDFQRQELRSLLASENVPWCEDETNDDEDYSRNFIRNSLIPLIHDRLNPAAEKHLSALSREISLLVEEQESETCRSLQNLRRPFPVGKQAWDVKTLVSLKKSTLSLCIRQEARELGFPALERERTCELVDLMLKGGRWCFQWKRNLQVCCGSGLIGWIEDVEAEPAISFEMSEHKGECFWGKWQVKWMSNDSCPENPPFKEGVTFSLLVRSPLPVTVTIKDLSRSLLMLETRPSCVPWWAGKGWPVFFIGSTMSWSPNPGLPCEIWAQNEDRGQWLSVSLIRKTKNGSGRFI